MTAAIFLASGITFIPGALLIGLGGLLGCGERPTRFAGLLLLLGLILLIVSATPMPPWLSALGGILLFAWGLSAWPFRRKGVRGLAQTLRIAIPTIAALSIILELPFLMDSNIDGHAEPRLFVIGDSLSAGLGDGSETWPQLLGKEHVLEVKNLAAAGATTHEARRQAEILPQSGGIVVVLIGGNDLLGGRSAAEFERDLEYILSKARDADRDVLMFELPLPPLWEGFGRVQRRLAAKYSVTLVPKRRLAMLLASEGATADGLHLSPAGHATLANLVWKQVRAALSPAKIGGSTND